MFRNVVSVQNVVWDVIFVSFLQSSGCECGIIWFWIIKILLNIVLKSSHVKWYYSLSLKCYTCREVLCLIIMWLTWLTLSNEHLLFPSFSIRTSSLIYCNTFFILRGIEHDSIMQYHSYLSFILIFTYLFQPFANISYRMILKLPSPDIHLQNYYTSRKCPLFPNLSEFKW